jgi:LuxR family maltose regulon positive regulatory protein
MVLADDASAPGEIPAKAAPPIVRDALDAVAHRARRIAGETVAIAPTSSAWSPVLVESVSTALAEKRGADARAMLDAALLPPQQEVPLATIEHAILTAWLAHTEGRDAESRRRLTEAFVLASEHGIVSAFVWAGPEVIKLVKSLPLTPTPFRSDLLESARENLRPPPDAMLPEPLTDRERELLAYLPTRMTNAELAARFFVSVNTIKTHMAHIYRKLDAPNRSTAVTRATELGLL